MFNIANTSSRTGCELYANEQQFSSERDFFGDRENWNIIQILEGNASLLIEGKKLALVPNRIYLIAPHISRRFQISSGFTILWAHFNLDAHLQHEPEWSKLCQSVLFVQLDEQNCAIIQRVFKELIMLCHEQMIGWYKLGYCLIQEIILRGNMIEQHGFNREMICRTVSLMENLGHQDTIRKLAAKSNMSKTIFYKRFKTAFGIGPNEYRERLLMNKAQAMLAETDLSIAEVAEKIGYCNSAYFSVRFRNMFGLSPKAFQKMSKLQQK